MNTHLQRSLAALALSSATMFALVACEACGGASGSRGSSTLLTVGQSAPAFAARDQSGATRTLAEFAGRPVVLFFYPRDGTPGCTREACAFRDSWDRLRAAGAVVLGVSTDGVDAHARFAADHQLPFPLLADPNAEIIRAYGVGMTLDMASRVTFIVGRDGRIARVYPHVDPGVHADEIVSALGELPSAAR